MRLWLTLLPIAAGLALTAIVWVASGGRAFVLILPLLFAAPFIWRGGAKGRGPGEG